MGVAQKAPGMWRNRVGMPPRRDRPWGWASHERMRRRVGGAGTLISILRSGGRGHNFPDSSPHEGVAQVAKANLGTH